MCTHKAWLLERAAPQHGLHEATHRTLRGRGESLQGKAGETWHSGTISRVQAHTLASAWKHTSPCLAVVQIPSDHLELELLI